MEFYQIFNLKPIYFICVWSDIAEGSSAEIRPPHTYNLLYVLTNVLWLLI